MDSVSCRGARAGVYYWGFPTWNNGSLIFWSLVSFACRYPRCWIAFLNPQGWCRSLKSLRLKVGAVLLVEYLEMLYQVKCEWEYLLDYSLRPATPCFHGPRTRMLSFWRFRYTTESTGRICALYYTSQGRNLCFFGNGEHKEVSSLYLQYFRRVTFMHIFPS